MSWQFCTNDLTRRSLGYGIGKDHVVAKKNACFSNRKCGLLRYIQWCHTYKCWNAVLNCVYSLGSRLTYNSTTLTSISWYESGHMWRIMCFICFFSASLLTCTVWFNYFVVQGKLYIPISYMSHICLEYFFYWCSKGESPNPKPPAMWNNKVNLDTDPACIFFSVMENNGCGELKTMLW